jgi:hypothetical protein
MIAIRDIAYVRYKTPHLDAMERFLLDFGLHRSARTDTALYMGGYGDANHVHITEWGTPDRAIGFGLCPKKVSKIVRILRELGYAAATPAEARSRLKLKGSSLTRF